LNGSTASLAGAISQSVCEVNIGTQAFGVSARAAKRWGQSKHIVDTHLLYAGPLIVNVVERKLKTYTACWQRAQLSGRNGDEGGDDNRLHFEGDCGVDNVWEEER
jgi:hypothetical protein